MTMRMCIRCGGEKPRDSYSKNQWEKGVMHSRCKECVSRAQPGDEQRMPNQYLLALASRRATSVVESSSAVRRRPLPPSPRPTSFAAAADDDNAPAMFSHSDLASSVAKRRRVLESSYSSGMQKGTDKRDYDSSSSSLEENEDDEELVIDLGVSFFNTPGETITVVLPKKKKEKEKQSAHQKYSWMGLRSRADAGPPEESVTVGDVKQSVQDATGIPAEAHRLVVDGRELRDVSKTLSECGVDKCIRRRRKAEAEEMCDDDDDGAGAGEAGGRKGDKGNGDGGDGGSPSPRLYVLAHRPGRTRINVRVVPEAPEGGGDGKGEGDEEESRRPRKTFALYVEPSVTTVRCVKGMIRDEEGIPPDSQRLVFGFTALEDDYDEGDGGEDAGGQRQRRQRPLSSYGIGEGSTLGLIVTASMCLSVVLTHRIEGVCGDDGLMGQGGGDGEGGGNVDDRKTIHLDAVDPSNAVGAVTRMIWLSEGIPVRNQRLFAAKCHGEEEGNSDGEGVAGTVSKGNNGGWVEMLPDRALSEYGVREGSALCLVKMTAEEDESSESDDEGDRRFGGKRTWDMHSNESDNSSNDSDIRLAEMTSVDTDRSGSGHGNNDAEEEDHSKEKQGEDRGGGRKDVPEEWTALPPSADCDASSFFNKSTELLCDRRRLRWALRTENDVRFAKLASRDGGEVGGSGGENLSSMSSSSSSLPSLSPAAADLSSEYVIDLYPQCCARGGNSRANDDASDATPPLHTLSRAERVARADSLALERKCLLPAALSREPDASFLESLPRVANSRDSAAAGSDGVGERRKPNALRRDGGGGGGGRRAVPPDLLSFRVLLEAYAGYRPLARQVLSLCADLHDDNEDLAAFGDDDEDFAADPRAAVMGGSVVAALASWRDPKVRALFEQDFNPSFSFLASSSRSEFDVPLSSASTDCPLVRCLRQWEETRSRAAAERYLWIRTELVRRLNHYFLFTENSNPKGQSVFAGGDVDLFLQASPLTRALQRKLLVDARLPPDAVDLVRSYLGGCGFFQGDLSRFAKRLCFGLVMEFENEEKLEASSGATPPAFVYALTEHALSFTLTQGEEESWDDDHVWPRTTQLIMLNEKADLLGGLMDFDISLAACAYDKTGVKVTPRALFSLTTLTQVVTPFVLQERRNRKRINKYYKRGFDAFVLDPYCSHPKQCDDQLTTMVKSSHSEQSGNRSFGNDIRYARIRRDVTVRPRAKWSSVDIHGYERYHELLSEIQADNNSPHAVIGIQCCCNVQRFDCRSNYVPECRFRTLNERGDNKYWYTGTQDYKYTLALFENSGKLNATEYFYQRHQWTDEELTLVKTFPLTRRFACLFCRREYGLRLIVEDAPLALQDDLLHGSVSYMHGTGHKGDFNPSFYSGGAFDSLRSGSSSKQTHKMMSTLRAQQLFERARYLQRHGTDEGYNDRFVYSEQCDEVFQEAGEVIFPPTGRPPVGLNPERFIGQCEGCRDWLHGCEFGTVLCEKCSLRKSKA